MKLKYYLRGAGIGILIATLVMMISVVAHNYNLTDEYIMKQARKLGMVMKDENNSGGGLFGNDETEDESTTEGSQSTEDEVTPPSESESQEPEPPSESETPPEPPSESETPSEPPSESESQEPEPPVSSEDGYVTIVIERGDYARQVAEKLYAVGAVPDAEEFRKYIGAHGYGQSIKVGTYDIPIGATYEEICKIITTKRQN